MSTSLKEPYGHYHPKKKGKRPVRMKEEKLLKRSYEWLKWKVVQIGDFSFHKPCLEQ